MLASETKPIGHGAPARRLGRHPRTRIGIAARRPSFARSHLHAGGFIREIQQVGVASLEQAQLRAQRRVERHAASHEVGGAAIAALRAEQRRRSQAGLRTTRDKEAEAGNGHVAE